MLRWAQRAPAMLFYTDLQLTIRLIAGTFNPKVRLEFRAGNAMKDICPYYINLLMGLC
jgi:hypothetical protein